MSHQKMTLSFNVNSKAVIDTLTFILLCAAIVTIDFFIPIPVGQIIIGAGLWKLGIIFRDLKIVYDETETDVVKNKDEREM